MIIESGLINEMLFKRMRLKVLGIPDANYIA